ncbi:hypothetical protein [Streptomyces sp. MUSC 125]|uniref:hypothetical protein n=1 Tax=Streptomyces sp. MUSC 125 TaxID=1428624 RepID=UPI00131E25E4|nr:hypothetical protein [Streptomyces sp. MUSC 125]
MKRTLKRTLQVALTTFVATATMGVFATSASAGDNTWISNKAGFCITASGGGTTYGTLCGWGNRGQLWDRVGSQIKLAYTNECLDSDRHGITGNVYWGQCNGGNFQNWDYVDVGGGWVTVQERETKLYLVMTPQWGTGIQKVWTSDRNDDYAWSFYGGE